MNPKAKLRNKADRLWFEKYLKPKCELCDNPAQQLHHFYYKSSYPHIRYLEENGISLCKGHHFLLHHKDPKPIQDEIIRARGKKWYEDLKEKAYNPDPNYKITISYYKKIIEEL